MSRPERAVYSLPAIAGPASGPVSRGAPIGEIGYGLDDLPADPAETPAETLCLVTGFFDDTRQRLSPDHDRWPLAAFARRWQDRWSDIEHRDFWTFALPLWPGQGGKPRNREALAWALAMARFHGIDEETMRRGIIADRNDLRDRDVLKLADRMSLELEGRHLDGDQDVPVPFVAPRVLTEDEYDARGRALLPLGAYPPLVGTGLCTGVVSFAVHERALAVVAEHIRAIP
jgi:hypothetical protein